MTEMTEKKSIQDLVTERRRQSVDDPKVLFSHEEAEQIAQALATALTAEASPSVAELLEDARMLYRTAEMSAAIMRDPERTGSWAGAARTADAFARIGLRAKKLHAALPGLLDRVEKAERKAKPAKEKRAPVQGLTGGIPWSLHLEAYDAYSKRWSPQPALIDLEGRNCRGGFSVGELDEFVPGWREEVSELTALRRRAEAAEAQAAAFRTRLEEAVKALERIAHGMTEAFDEGLVANVEVWLSADELREIARATLSRLQSEEGGE